MQMKIIPLHQGIYSVDSQKRFDLLSPESNNLKTIKGLCVSICPFLIVLDQEIILLDAGLGVMNNGTELVVDLIEKAGFNACQVTKVLISHLHKDHIDGIGSFKENEFIVNFPNAIVYIQQRELDFALQQEQNLSYNFKILNQLKLLSNVEFLESNQGKISSDIFYEVSAGHTPFHQVFWIKKDKEIVFYGADDLPQQSYLNLPVAYKTDYDGKHAMESRKKWEQQAKEQHWKILLYHDLKASTLEL